jgi:hypothetical protein
VARHYGQAFVVIPVRAQERQDHIICIRQDDVALQPM